MRDQFAALYDGKPAEVANLDPDEQVALKRHEGTCLGIDMKMYARRIRDIGGSARSRQKALDARCRRLLPTAG